MTETTTDHPCEIVPIERHDPDGITFEWGVQESWADRLKADGFESPEHAIDWATKNGYTPDLRQVNAHRLEKAIEALGPYEAARVVVRHLSIHQLVRFDLEFRRQLDYRVTAEDHAMNAPWKE